LTKQKTALIFWTNKMHRLSERQTGKKGLKFHMRVLGQQPWVLTCWGQFQIRFRCLVAPYASKNRHFILISRSL